MAALNWGKTLTRSEQQTLTRIRRIYLIKVRVRF